VLRRILLSVDCHCPKIHLPYGAITALGLSKTVATFGVTPVAETDAKFTLP
jgi:hypothetical protein